MIYEESAGAVVFYDSERGPEYLVLLYDAGHWDFPKGGLEFGESEIDAAIREVREETGLENIQIIEGFRKEIEYMYHKKRDLVKKRVAFYLAKSDTKEVKLSYEHKDFAWLDYENAMRRLTFKTAKDTLAEAHRFLMQNQKKLSET
ncbi:MAG: NUDIX domain-containing protein [Aigarchaeota archaeon]|nr:NUDIX domain-containing protein [Candidatus Pelearchaeum maunauluense]